MSEKRDERGEKGCSEEVKRFLSKSFAIWARAIYGQTYALLMLTCVAVGSDPAGERADRAFLNGHIWTGEDGKPVAEGLFKIAELPAPVQSQGVAGRDIHVVGFFAGEGSSSRTSSSLPTSRKYIQR